MRIPGNRAHPYYAVRVAKDFRGLSAEKAAEELRRRWRIEPGDQVYLYTGLGDWDGEITPARFAKTLRPLIAGIRHLGATPILLSCEHMCAKEKKEKVAEMLGILLTGRMEAG
ncbi:hypothetical protein HYW67_04505 [Candidatus Parcubacteria bacterium]|nr:hypothetical protein [Candidatus Parcubacteria bacterium]